MLFRSGAVTLGGNPWDCTCSIRDIVGWIRRHESVVSDKEDMKCYSPEHLELRKLYSLQDEEFSVCDTTPSSYLPTTPPIEIYVSPSKPSSTPSSFIPFRTTTSIITTSPTTALQTSPNIVLFESDNPFQLFTEALPPPPGDSYFLSFPPFYDRLVVEQGQKFIHNNRMKSWVYIWSLSSDSASASLIMALHILLVAAGVTLILATIYGMYRLQQSIDDFWEVASENMLSIQKQKSTARL